MTSLDELRNERIKKLEVLQERGRVPYPVSVQYDATLKEVREKFVTLAKRKKPLFLVGRITALRKQGGLIFLNFTDGTDTFQGLFKKNEMDASEFKDLADTVDVGDFIELQGTLFATKKKEKTILVKKWKMLVKSLRPLPEKWHGLKDVEEKFRKRYLDTLMSSESRERFISRSRLIGALRRVLTEADFLEVETPVLQPLYGGASAEPFVTHHNALDVDLYLRISDELYLKRLLVGNFSKVFEIYKAFRNEGIDVTHYPEFTMVEWYESYSDADSQMVFVEQVVEALAKELFKGKSFTWNEKAISVKRPFKRVTYASVLKRYALIPDIETIDRNELSIKAKQLGVSVGEGESKEKILDNIFKKACRPKIIQPTFIIDYPADALPLAKKKEENDSLVDAFQLVICGVELAKGFSELNDPIEQRARFKGQEVNRSTGDKEAQQLDEDFLEALEYGMPPAGGVGIGIDRLVMLLTDTKNIKDVILFPAMRSKE